MNFSATLKPLSRADFLTILPWRNAQLSILRQDKELTVEEQETYANWYFSDDFPAKTLLFGYVFNSKMIAYGGLTHIDWEKSSAETSFLMDPALKHDLLFYSMHYMVFLMMLRSKSRNLGITVWRSETYTDTKDPTRNIHIAINEKVLGCGVIHHIENLTTGRFSKYTEIAL